MKTPIAVLLSLTLLALAGLHLYWGFGGVWPGRDEANLVEMVIGRTPGMRVPGLIACAVVAAALAATAALVWAKTKGPRSGPGAVLIALGFWGAAAVFAARGAVTYAGDMFRYAEGTPFYGLNLTIYSPLCLAIAAGFLVVGLAPRR